MMYSVRVFRALLISLLLAGGRPGLAQFVATAKAFPRTTHQAERPQTQQLREVLNQFKVRYQVDILFEDRLVSDQLVNPGLIDLSASLEKNLTKLLKPQGLRFSKVKNGVYVVLEENKARKQTSMADINTLPMAVAASNEQPQPIQPGQIQTKELTLTTVDQTINGQVTDGATGNGLPGVSVVVKGTSRGTTTDGEGNYRVNVPDQNTGSTLTLVFSFIGYTTQEVVVGNRSSVNVTLASDDKTLNEVVVVGYGTQNRRELTGSVASLQTQTIKDQPVTNVVEGLTGRMPGVLVQQNTGAPGNAPSIKVRGLGSISAGNGPLVVVDGQPLNSGGLTNAGGLNQLNPNDIEKIDVLKDASATAIYGSRGSNGVVMVTTKRGKSGQSRINFDYFTGTQQVSKKMDMLNAQQFAEYSKEAFNTAYLERVPGAKITDPNSARPALLRYRYPRGEFPGANFDDPTSLTSYDYQDMIFRKAPISNYQLSASGGTEKVQYFISGNYLKQDGIIKKSGIDRYTVRSNIDAQLSSKLKVGLSFSPSFMAENRVNSDGHWASNGVINAALSLPPFMPIYQANGTTYNSQAFYAAPYDWPGITNPVANITEVDNRVTQLRLLGNAYAELSIWKTLRYRGTIGGDLNYLRQNQYQTSAIPLNQLLPPNVSTGSAYTNQNINWVTNHTLSYTLDLGTTHHLDALVGLESQRNDYEESRVNANNFPNDIVRSVNAGTIIGGTSYRDQWSLASYFARVTYSYKDRYLFNASVRRDGSSRFGQTSRFGTFPSASIGWRVIEESFMKAVPLISELKLRASYGLSGNNAFRNNDGSTNNYPAIGVLSKDNYVLGSALANGLATSSIANPQLSWEKSRQTDVGLDLGLFQNRILLTVDYYKRITTDLLLEVQVPTLTGFSTAVRNIGQVENKGMEFALSTRNINGSGAGAFTWTTDLNISFNRNKVLALGPTGDPIRSGTGVGETNITVIGQPLGSFFGYRQLGIFRDQTDLDSYPHFADSRPGDVKFEDVNGDKKIDANDRTTIGNNQPDFIYGITNSLSFKGFDLNIVAQGVQGGQILNLSRRFYENLEGNANELTTVLGRWRSPQEPGDGVTPRANTRSTGNNNQVSSRWVESATYFRIRNITLGYNVPRPFLQKIKVQSLRVYAGVQNALTVSKYLAYNPEVSGYEGPLTGGVDYGSYPLARTYTIGLNLGF
ncbi:SusC/RagA family TonB-linked outer membrane protein [Spirosoma endbachense]|uniref:SusC/RagA family TonB-linked outer membrane protein n=1 Tax=Spirosoma endbachense TaxID=2666025 RepID=A0A6P1VU38_9BACT|nr:TonB-dependent receptor [Spirosoma endbachense]QHV95918.1 SusC/RagA family TonB-linked outer membrane protein [Spirosoma endbachense]